MPMSLILTKWVSHAEQHKVFNKKFWEELIHLLSLYKLTVNKLVAMVTMENKQPKPIAVQGSPNEVGPQYFYNY
jgi:hypothetical protein